MVSRDDNSGHRDNHSGRDRQSSVSGNQAARCGRGERAQLAKIRRHLVHQLLCRWETNRRRRIPSVRDEIHHNLFHNPEFVTDGVPDVTGQVADLPCQILGTVADIVPDTGDAAPKVAPPTAMALTKS